MRRVFLSLAALLLLLSGALPAMSPARAQQEAAPVENVAPAPAELPAIDRSAPRGLSPEMHDLSPWRMFLGADMLVKGVMVGLVLASLATWTVFIAKTLEMSMAKSRLRTALDQAGTAGSLAAAQQMAASRQTVLSTLLSAAENELRLSGDLRGDAGVKERVASSLSEVVKAEASTTRSGMGLLATIGSTSPFVGLFGTVWGIMNSFIGISKAQTTNLAVVAPGIAEALLATAIGLVAAIPAVIIYNHFSRQTKAYLELVHRASGITSRIVSRDLDRLAEAVPARMRA
jgi:biopolymer transport protein ExbB